MNKNFHFPIYDGLIPKVMLFSFISLLLFSLSKVFFTVIIFILLDFIKNFLELKTPFKYIPIKIMDIGIITVSYLFGLSFGLILIAFFYINKIIFSRLDDQAINSLPSLIITCLLTFILNQFHFLIVTISLFIMRYIINFLTDLFFLRYLKISNIPARILNIIFAYFIFNFIYFMV
jgi:hypothetical protein